MANLNLLDGIMWQVTDPYEEADLHHGYDVIYWDSVVLPRHNFVLKYPIFIRDPDEGYINESQEIPYNTDGQPVTVRDLLATIYNFYQEPVNHTDTRFDPEHVTKGDTLLGFARFEGLTQTGLNSYEVITEP